MVLLAFAWDDGAVEDLKMTDLAVKYGIPGIFFIPASNPERKVLEPGEIKTINTHFEIGAHTYSHRYLSKLPVNEAGEEIVKGKDFLEQLLGRKTEHFCFPGGQYNAKLLSIAHQHFISARTADTGATIEKGAFVIRPALHFYDRGRLSLLYNSAKHRSIIFPAVLKNISETHYFELLKKIISALDSIDGEQRIIVWGHSWEIEQESLWNCLEDFFRWLNTCYPGKVRTYSEILGRPARL